jgi:hypothetical protein
MRTHEEPQCNAVVRRTPFYRVAMPFSGHRLLERDDALKVRCRPREQLVLGQLQSLAPSPLIE